MKTMYRRDVLPLIAGVYSFLSPLWTTSPHKATWTMVTLGIITALAAVNTLAERDPLTSEGVVALLGVLFFISPWVMDFTGSIAIAWTAWVVGAITFVVSAINFPMARAHHGHMVHPH